MSSILGRLPRNLRRRHDATCEDVNELGKAPWLLKYRSNKGFIIFTISLAVFTDIFLYAVIVPVVPFALHDRVGIGQDEIQSWVSVLVAVYGGSLAAFSPLCGWAADKTSSRRLPLVLGLLALAGATIMLNLGSSIAILVVGRILQGLSAAVVWVVGLALAADTVGKAEVAVTMGYVFIGTSLGYLLGPLLGGIVFDRAGYNAVFGMSYALLGMDVALRFLLIEKKIAKKWERPEAPQLERRPEEKSPTPNEGGLADEVRTQETPAPTLKDDGFMTLPQPEERTTSDRPGRRIRFPPVFTLLKSRRLLSALWASMVAAIILTQFDSVLPLYVKDIFAWDSIGAGALFLAIVVPSLLGPFIGQICDKYGGRWVATAGFIIATPAEACLRFVDHDSINQKVLLCALLALIGSGIALLMTPVMAEIMLVVAAKEERNPGVFGAKGAYAQAYGLFNLAFAIGCLIGPLWGGYINNGPGWATLSWTMALLAGISAVPTAIWTDGSVFKLRARKNAHDTDTV